jgi:hypothetical protein
MKGIRICIAQVFELCNRDAQRGTTMVVLLDVRNAEKEAEGVAFTRVGMSAPCYTLLTGREPVVGDTFEIATSQGEWKPWQSQ